MFAGFGCGDVHCDRGEACIRCGGTDELLSLCVPHPDMDLEGYGDAIAVCEVPPAGMNDCDGPEDCAADEWCVVDFTVPDDPTGRPREGTQCRDEPALGSCCFDCSARPECTLCREQADCPTETGCNEDIGAPGDSGGCVVIPA
jgi:hypothetical protein